MHLVPCSESEPREKTAPQSLFDQKGKAQSCLFPVWIQAITRQSDFTTRGRSVGQFIWHCCISPPQSVPVYSTSLNACLVPMTVFIEIRSGMCNDIRRPRGDPVMIIHWRLREARPFIPHICGRLFQLRKVPSTPACHVYLLKRKAVLWSETTLVSTHCPTLESSVLDGLEKASLHTCPMVELQLV